MLHQICASAKNLTRYIDRNDLRDLGTGMRGGLKKAGSIGFLAGGPDSGIMISWS